MSESIPHYKSPRKEVDSAALEAKEKSAIANHEKILQEKKEKAQVSLERVDKIKEKKNQEIEKLKEESDSKLNQAAENREKLIQQKVEKCREEVEHAKEVHDRVRSNTTKISN